jgi:hypothetical protein
MPIDEVVRESGATIFSIAGLLMLFLSIPRGLEPPSAHVAVAACFAKRVASLASEAGRNCRTWRSDGVVDEYWDRTAPPICRANRTSTRSALSLEGRAEAMPGKRLLQRVFIDHDRPVLGRAGADNHTRSPDDRR